MDVGYGVTIGEDELVLRYTRARGPGGQNVNKRSTRAELTFDLANSPSIPPDLKSRAKRRLRARLDAEGRLRIVADAERTQRANREAALERLERTLREALRPPPPPRRPTKPSRAAVKRRVDEKKRRGQVKRRRGQVARED